MKTVALVEKTNDFLVLKVRRNQKMTDEKVRDFMNWLELEILTQEVNFDESIAEVGEMIKKGWWKKNKSWILERTGIKDE